MVVDANGGQAETNGANGNGKNALITGAAG
jgi:hypothetical protein